MSDEQTPPPADPPRPPAAPARAAVIQREVRVHFGSDFVRLPGGQRITHPPHVDALAGCEGVLILEAPTAAALEAKLARYDKDLADLRARAERLGYVLVPHGDHLRRD